VRAQTDEDGWLLEPFVQLGIRYCERLALADDRAAADDVVWNSEREIHFGECGGEVQDVFGVGISQGEWASLLFCLFGILFVDDWFRECEGHSDAENQVYVCKDQFPG
jgi:hypothetical protein